MSTHPRATPAKPPAKSRVTKSQLESTLRNLLIVTETEQLTGEQRDHIGAVRSLLWDLLDNRDRR